MDPNPSNKFGSPTLGFSSVQVPGWASASLHHTSQKPSSLHILKFLVLPYPLFPSSFPWRMVSPPRQEWSDILKPSHRLSFHHMGNPCYCSRRYRGHLKLSSIVSASNVRDELCGEEMAMYRKSMDYEGDRKWAIDATITWHQYLCLSCDGQHSLYFPSARPPGVFCPHGSRPISGLLKVPSCVSCFVLCISSRSVIPLPCTSRLLTRVSILLVPFPQFSSLLLCFLVCLAPTLYLFCVREITVSLSSNIHPGEDGRNLATDRKIPREVVFKSALRGCHESPQATVNCHTGPSPNDSFQFGHWLDAYRGAEAMDLKSARWNA